MNHSVSDLSRVINNKIEEFKNELINHPVKTMEDYRHKIGVIAGLKLAMEMFDALFKPDDTVLPGFSAEELDEY